jgi:hypothetical protein
MRLINRMVVPTGKYIELLQSDHVMSIVACSYHKSRKAWSYYASEILKMNTAASTLSLNVCKPSRQKHDGSLLKVVSAWLAYFAWHFMVAALWVRPILAEIIMQTTFTTTIERCRFDHLCGTDN